MHLKLFSIFLLTFTLNSNSQEFDEERCFRESFSLKLERNVGPFGIGKRELVLKKEKCELTLNYQAFQQRKTRWVIDVCREPIHIKKGEASVKVIKKDAPCSTAESLYCEQTEELLNVIQDEVLIFASGQREDLNSDHGKAYCTFLLAKKYLHGNTAFRLSSSMSGVLIPKINQEKKVLSVTSQASSDEEQEADLIDYSVKTNELSNF